MLHLVTVSCKRKLQSSSLGKNYWYSNEGIFNFEWFPNGNLAISSLHRTGNIQFIGFITCIPSRLSWSHPLYDMIAKIYSNQKSLTTRVYPEATDDEIFDQILASIDDPHLEETCTSHIKTSCAAKHTLGAFRLLRRLRGKNIFLGPPAYDFLLESASKENDFELLSEIFKDLLVYCKNIRLSSYLILSSAFGKCDDSTVLEFITEICEMVLPRKDIVLNRVIFALSRCGFVEKALLVFNSMKSLKQKPDVVTYNTIMDTLGRLGRVDELLREFAFMKRVDLVPDIVTYNTVLNGLRKVGRLDLLLLYFREMKDRGLRPDSISYKALIECLGRSGNIEEALKVFEEMRSRGIRPSIYVFRSLIFSLKKMGKMDLAVKLSKEMNELVPEFVGPRDFRYKNP